MAKGNLRADMLLAGEDSGARMSRIGASLLLHGEVLHGRRGPARASRPSTRRGARGGGAAGLVAPHAGAVGPFDEHDFESHLPAMAAR